jgi:hypothetical protein
LTFDYPQKDFLVGAIEREKAAIVVAPVIGVRPEATSLIGVSIVGFRPRKR